jgi:hypothetical protein
MYLSPGGNTGDNPITVALDIPCDDTWHIFVRGWDEDNSDSFYAQLDGVPADETDWIFDFDCTAQSNGWTWQHLNERLNGNCDTSAGNDYDPVLVTGVHQLNLFDREDADMSRLWITNDPAGTPP